MLIAVLRDQVDLDQRRLVLDLLPSIADDVVPVCAKIPLTPATEQDAKVR
jgi:hypothetical protein